MNYILNIKFRLQDDQDHCSFEIVSKHDNIFFNNCVFADNFYIFQVLNGEWLDNIEQDVAIINCTFKNNTVIRNLLYFHHSLIPLKA